MKKKELYTCEICGTDYADKANAMACEKAHKKVDTAKITGRYTCWAEAAAGPI